MPLQLYHTPEPGQAPQSLRVVGRRQLAVEAGHLVSVPLIEEANEGAHGYRNRYRNRDRNQCSLGSAK